MVKELKFLIMKLHVVWRDHSKIFSRSLWRDRQSSVQPMSIDSLMSSAEKLTLEEETIISRSLMN